MATIMCIIGLGWGRATRTATARELATGEAETQITVDAITTETPDELPGIGEESVDDLQAVDELFDSSVVVQFVSFWIIGPSIATLLSYGFFVVIPIAGTG